MSKKIRIIIGRSVTGLVWKSISGYDILSLVFTAKRIPPVINLDNKLITGGMTGWKIWIDQIIKGTTNRTSNIS